MKRQARIILVVKFTNFTSSNAMGNLALDENIMNQESCCQGQFFLIVILHPAYLALLCIRTSMCALLIASSHYR